MASEEFKTWVNKDKFEDASSDLQKLFGENGVLQRGWNTNRINSSFFKIYFYFRKQEIQLVIV